MMLNLLKKLQYILEKGLNVLAKLNQQTDKKIIFLKYYLEKKLIQKIKNQSKDIEYIKKVQLHPRERLQYKKRIKQKPEIRSVKTVLQHPRDRLSRRLKNKPANIIYDEAFLKEFPYFNRKIKVNERQLNEKLLNSCHQTIINGMLNTTEILIHIILERKMKKNCYRQQCRR